MKNKVSRPDTSKIIMQLIFFSLLIFILLTWLFVWIPFALIFVAVIFNNETILQQGENLRFIVAMIGTIIIDIFLYPYLRKSSLGQALSNGYRWSIREALQVEHPEGIVYILDSILKQFDKFGFNLQPQRINYSETRTRNPNGRAINEGISDVKGFPNRTNLKETINLAQTLSQEIANSQFTLAEKGRSMDEIRKRIQAEDMWLDWKILNLKNKYDLDVYWFSYTEEDHRNNQSFSPPPSPSPQTPPSPQKQNPSTLLTFEEWVAKNPVIQQFTETEQRQAYQRYRQSQTINKLTFEEWLEQNPELQYFSEEQQRQAYQNYLD
jgi:hypothetical protein